MKTTLGTCGCCGGPVTVPSVWMGIIPPTPQCERCGAVPREAHGPVLEMGGPSYSPHSPATNKITVRTGSNSGGWS